MSSSQTIHSLQDGSAKYRELATGILLQYADSEMAGGAGYSNALSLAPGLAERVCLAKIAAEKLSLAQKTYELIAQTGINIEKYVSSHCWETRLHRDISLGFRRASADKRVNALMYPIQSWEDLAAFTYLMASMACLQLHDFSKSSFEPWSKLAASHICVEETHRDFGFAAIETISKNLSQREILRQSIIYWKPRVLACFGPAHSDRNQEYIDSGLKTKRNDELSNEWLEIVSSSLEGFGILPQNCTM